MDLQGRVALVTGAGRRLGREIAVALASAGMPIAVHHHTAIDGAQETVRRIEAGGGTARTFPGDLLIAGTPAELTADVATSFGRLDVIVNSAAIMKRTPYGDVTTEEWDTMFTLNLRAPFFLAQAAMPYLQRAPGGGAVVNIADLAAFETWPAYVPHGISKAGVVHMTRALARVMAPAVRVNAVAPGAVLLPDGWTEADAARLRDTTPLGRLGSPADVTEAVLFLLRADYVTGETLIVDGGRRARH